VELIDANTAAEILQVSRSTLSHLTERSDVDLDAYVYEPPGKKRRAFLLREQVERLAASGDDWRIRGKRGEGRRKKRSSAADAADLAA
jgi:hypothetical protein